MLEVSSNGMPIARTDQGKRELPVFGGLMSLMQVPLHAVGFSSYTYDIEDDFQIQAKRPCDIAWQLPVDEDPGISCAPRSFITR